MPAGSACMRVVICMSAMHVTCMGLELLPGREPVMDGQHTPITFSGACFSQQVMAQMRLHRARP